MEKVGKEARDILDRLGGEDALDGRTRPKTTQGTKPLNKQKKPKASRAGGKAAPKYADQKEVSPNMKRECTVNRKHRSSVHDALERLTERHN